MITAIRLGALALGVSCAGLGAFGAYEFALRLEGGVSYLVLAAPLIAVTAALIPPIAEATWRGGHPLKALFWWAILVPAGAVVFFFAVRAGPRSQGRCASRAQCSPWRRGSCPGSTHQGRSGVGQGERRRQRSACCEAVRSCLQDQTRGRSNGHRWRGSCETGAVRPQRTALSRRRRGCSRRRLIWLPSWRSGRASQGTVQGRFASLFRSSVEWPRSAS